MLCRNTKTGHIYDYNVNLKGQLEIELISQVEELELRKKTVKVKSVEEAKVIVSEEEETVEPKPKKVKKSKEV